MRYPRHDLPLVELVHEGRVGLIRAAERFDHRRGRRFSTYASWWIRESISKALAETGRAIRLPVGMTREVARIREAELELQRALGRPPTTAELAVQADLPAACVQQLSRATAPITSLEEPPGDDGALGGRTTRPRRRRRTRVRTGSRRRCSLAEARARRPSRPFGW